MDTDSKVCPLVLPETVSAEQMIMTEVQYQKCVEDFWNSLRSAQAVFKTIEERDPKINGTNPEWRNDMLKINELIKSVRSKHYK